MASLTTTAASRRGTGRIRLLLLSLALAGAARAGTAPFDLAGPSLEVKVTRGATTLPASQVPNLQAGDRLWIRADLSANQAAQYVLIVAFLRGSTNPPPEDWFYPCRTWSERCGTDGLAVTVPQGAGQGLLFLAPATRGDVRTLMGAVRGRPGTFVRASQDLNQAALDRSRLDRYLATIHGLGDADPARLKEVAPLLARSLAIKVDEKCLDKAPVQQAPCLMQGEETLILNDGHSTSIVQALTSGPGADLAMEASYTPQLRYGYYSPYVASVLDIARLMDSFHTAQYEYIPALALPRKEQLTLTLNTAPSFGTPKSVLVTALPAVERPQPPPLHSVDPKEIYCADRAALVLPVEGAPLVFSTDYAHQMTLTLSGSNGRTVRLPARPDAAQGGYVIDTSSLVADDLGPAVDGALQGFWGFDTYAGPRFHLTNARDQRWTLAAGEDEALIAGRLNTVHLQADSVSCLDRIMLRDPAGKELKADWKRVKANEVEVQLPLQDVQPGAMSLVVAQYGAKSPHEVALRAFPVAGRFDSFDFNAGDGRGLLKGSRLDEVASLTIGGVVFEPGELSSWNGGDELPMLARDAAAAAALKPGQAVDAKIALKDGRGARLRVTVGAPRPRVVMIGKNIAPSHAAAAGIELTSPDELPQDARITFSLRAQSPAAFTHDESIEVSTADQMFSATLTLGNGGLRLEDAHVAVATIDPARLFGPSAFGELRYRVLANNAIGDWQPLATLVRVPQLQDVQCPASPELACRLTGSDLYLLASIADNPQLDRAVTVPDGFPGSSMPVPHPAGGRLYVKLRDDPAVVHAATPAVRELPPTPDELARAAARHEAAEREAPAPADPHAPSDGATGAAPSSAAEVRVEEPRDHRVDLH